MSLARPSVAATGQENRGPAAAGRALMLVHRGVRHEGPTRGEGAIRRVGLNRKSGRTYKRSGQHPRAESDRSFTVSAGEHSSSSRRRAAVGPGALGSVCAEQVIVWSKEKMTWKGLAVMVVVVCSLAMGLAAAQQGATRKRSPSVRPEPAGEYERCEEQCPPPGLSASPGEI
jgi:predicted RNA-binding Zn-ribbon protein involved in translation (DUF1610 family)